MISHTMPRHVTWLHVSDFHFKDGDAYDRNVVLRSLVLGIPRNRRVAQLGERGPYKAEVAGSIPAPPTSSAALGWERHAILTAAAFSRPSSFTLSSRMRNFWTLPVTVMGKPSTNFT